METETTIEHAEPSPRQKLALHALTFERFLMGVVFIGCGIAGILSLVPHGSADIAAAGGSVAKMGFLFPLLKGTEVLLELYLGSIRRKP